MRLADAKAHADKTSGCWGGQHNLATPVQTLPTARAAVSTPSTFDGLCFFCGRGALVTSPAGVKQPSRCSRAATASAGSPSQHRCMRSHTCIHQSRSMTRGNTTAAEHTAADIITDETFCQKCLARPHLAPAKPLALMALAVRSPPCCMHTASSHAPVSAAEYIEDYLTTYNHPNIVLVIGRTKNLKFVPPPRVSRCVLICFLCSQHCSI